MLALGENASPARLPGPAKLFADAPSDEGENARLDRRRVEVDRAAAEQAERRSAAAEIGGNMPIAVESHAVGADQPVQVDVCQRRRALIVQTPAYVFPIEPHFVMPFMHWLPRALARRLAHVSPWRLLSHPTAAHIDAYFGEIRLLRRAELQALLPQARIVTERCAALPKSYLAVVAPETCAARPAA